MNLRLILAAMLVLAVAECNSQGAEVALRRWAVIASPEVRELGVSDLLTAELTQREFDLVEREQLDTISKEIELTQLLGAKTKERLNVGLRLKADALVLLSMVKNEKTSSLKVVISECRQGARLRLELLPISSEERDVGAANNSQALIKPPTKESNSDLAKSVRPEELSRRCAVIIGETRTQFAAGVQQLFAVSPLHSKNLTRDFDYLQVGYSALLGRAISQMPGTALVEIDKARAIRQELAAVGEAEVAGRPAPMFIEGEFAMRGRDEAVRVRINLRLTDGKANQRLLKSDVLTQEQAVDWLLDVVPREAVRTREGKPNGKRWTRREQFEKLAERAELFSATAAFEEAASLREAALLLANDDVEQRFWLIGDLRRRQTEHLRQIFDIKRELFRSNQGVSGRVADIPLTGVEYRSQFEEIRQRWERMGDLARWLVAKRAMSRREATTVFVTLARDARTVMSFLEADARDEIQNAAEQLPWTLIENFGQLDFALRSESGHPALHRAGFLVIGKIASEGEVHDRLCQDLADYWGGKFLEYGSTLPDQHNLKSWTRFVADHASRKMYSHHLVLGMSNYRNLRDADRVTKEQLAASCDRMDQTGEELIQAYARCGRLAIRMAETAGKVDETMRKEAAEVRKVFRRYGVSDLASFLLNEIESKAQSKSFKKHALSTNTLLGTDPAPRIAFEPLPEVRGLAKTAARE